jgi:hypothetical protein
MQINTNQLRKFADNLIKIKTISFPQIINNLLNTTIYNISNNLKKEVIPKTFIKRNNFAPMSIRYDKAKGHNLNTMFAIVGQLQNAGQNNTKTILEENELGKPIQSKTKHTTLGLKTIRINNSFNKIIKKENRLTTLKPKLARNILQETYNKANNKQKELSCLSILLLKNKITLNNPVIAHTKENTIGVFKLKKSAEDKNKVNITKLYSLKNKTTPTKQRIWLKNTGEKQLNNLNPIYQKTAKNTLDKNARAFHTRIVND